MLYNILYFMQHLHYPCCKMFIQVEQPPHKGNQRKTKLVVISSQQGNNQSKKHQHLADQWAPDSTKSLVLHHTPQYHHFNRHPLHLQTSSNNKKTQYHHSKRHPLNLQMSSNNKRTLLSIWNLHKWYGLFCRPVEKIMTTYVI